MQPERRRSTHRGRDQITRIRQLSPDDHALGRSRGGWTTKIHALVDQRCAAVMLRLTGGQAHDNPHLAPMIAAYTAIHGRQFRLLADKGYAHDSTRIHLRAQRIAHMIPERSDQIARRAARGSRGGRPPAFDPLIYVTATPSNAPSTDSNTGAAW